MKTVIKLTEGDLYTIVSKVLKTEKHRNNNLTFNEELDNLLEFHVKFYKSCYNVDGNHNQLEKYKRKYIKNLFPDNNKVIKEYHDNFKNRILNESVGENYVDYFFGFIRNNFIKQSTSILREYYKNDNNLINEEGFLDSAWNAAKQVGGAVVSGAKYVANKIGEGFNWLKKNGLGWLMSKIRSFLDSGWGQAAQLFLDSFAVGAIVNVVAWGLMTVWDLITKNWGLFLLSALSVLTAGALAPFVGKLAKNFKGITGGIETALGMLKSTSLGKTIIKWIPKIKSGLGSVGKYIGQGVEWLLSKFGKYIPSNWVSALKSGVSTAVKWVESVAQKIFKFAGEGAGENVATRALSRFEGTPSIQKLLTNPKWANSVKGIDAATSKLVDEYITANARKYSWSSIEKGICSKMNKQACNAVKVLGKAYEIKREGGEAYKSGKEAEELLLKSKNLARKRDKAKELYRSGVKVKDAANKVSELM